MDTIFRRRLTVVSTLAAFALCSAITAEPVYAATWDTEAIQIVRHVAPSVLENAATTGRTAQLEINVNADSENGFTVAASSGAQLDVSLPEAATRHAMDGTTITYDHGSGFSTVVVPKTDGSVQIATAIKEASAPTSYSYTLSVEGGEHLQQNKDGSITILDVNGEFAAGVAAPWAIDAAGRMVPTRYLAAGDKLTQVVEHMSQGFKYPIVADPWLGIDLVSSFYWTHPAQGYKLNIAPTPWARANNVATGGWAQVGVYGWDELYNKQHNTATATAATWRSRMNNSMRDQYICHMGFASVDAEWNLEQWSPNNGLAWHITQQCQ